MKELVAENLEQRVD